MDNIKKFEDFLDRMQGLLNNAKKQGHIIVRVEDLENAFPELKESDDERIRKALINGFNKLDKSAVWYNGITNGQILAWLEKQNEQKPVIEMKTVSESLGFTTQKECDDYNKMVTDLIMSDDGKGEQKPAWSKEDEDMCYKAIAVINRLCAEGKDYVWSIKTLEKLFYWLKSLKDRVGCEVNCTTTEQVEAE